MTSTTLVGDIQQGVEVRQGRIITQIISRPSTTFTTYVTLGGGPPPPPTQHPTTTVEVVQAAPTVIPAQSTSPQLSNEQIGAILGSVFGFIFLLLVLCCCLSARRQRRGVVMYDSSSTSEEEVVQVIRGHGQVGDPWRRPTRMPGVVPPPTRIPPTPRHTPYRQTRHAQIRGVQRYP